MRMLSKYAVTAALAGALALAAATPTQARWNGHHGGWHRGGGAAAVIGFGAGALLGAAAANANAGYYYAPGYYDYGYAPAPAYGPAPVYAEPAPGGCWHSTDADRGYGYYGSCY